MSTATKGRPKLLIIFDYLLSLALELKGADFAVASVSQLVHHKHVSV